LGEINIGKRLLNKKAKAEIRKFINSNFWNRILEAIKKKEEDLLKENQ